MRSHTDPARVSWLDTAGTDFPIQNLPFAVFRRTGDPRVGIGIGNQILDMRAVSETGLLGDVDDELHGACRSRRLNRLMSEGRRTSVALQRIAADLLDESSTGRERVERCLLPMAEADLLVPARIGDYTDFYASIDHATKVGSLFRPDNPLLPNYKWIPIGYHGRASSIVTSGTDVRRPKGQIKPSPDASPEFAATRRLDYELEIGAFVAAGNDQGSVIDIAEAEEHILGMCLVNDWSARDVQAWEYQPLGPFLGKSFATTVSPWIVTIDSLEPFRTARRERDADDPQPLPYLESADDRARGAFDITLEVFLSTAAMREAGAEPHRVSRGSFRSMYWTFAQMLTHHASNGCNLRPGDLLASGTVSGPEPEARGCLLEITSGGKDPLHLPSGESRTFLEDGDEVILRARCIREGAITIGFGECRGRVVPAG